jgi:hypothetical protein
MRIRRRLTSLPGLLRADGFTAVPPYKHLHQHAVNGVIPGAHQVNSIWHIFEDEVPAIGAALELERLPAHQNSVAA